MLCVCSVEAKERNCMPFVVVHGGDFLENFWIGHLVIALVLGSALLVFGLSSVSYAAEDANWAGAGVDSIPVDAVKANDYDPIDDLPEEVQKAVKGALPMETIDLWESSLRQIDILVPMQPKKLILRDCDEVTDFSPLAKMTSLKSLNLRGTQFADLRLLAGLKLEELNLLECPNIADYSPLAQMKTLKSLSVGGSVACKDLSFVVPLNLEYFRASESEEGSRVDLSVLAGMKHLRTLQIDHLYNVDCATFAGLPLDTLTIDECSALLNVEAVGKMKSLRTLFLTNLPLRGIKFAEGLPLQWLKLNGCSELADITPVATMPKLEKLSLADTAVTSLTPVRNLPLRELNIWFCKGITDLVPLKGKTSLQSIVTDGTKFAEVTLSEIVKQK